ncbi:MAG: PadR family transcriptional regulator [Gemmatimonas sp.]|nr:PadR family transcriptional regulator [Gemmatimonas sp.]
MRTYPLPLGNDVLYLLLALDRGPRHGYALLREVEAVSGGEVRILTGTLYRRLRRMLDDGLIEEVPAPAGEASADERRRYYAITTFGREVASAEVRRMQGVVRAAAGRLGGRPRTA